MTSPSTIRAMADAVREARARVLDATPEASRPSIAAYGDYFTRFEGAPCVVVPIHRPLTILSSLTEGHLPADDHAAIARMEAESGLVGVSLAVMQLLLAAHARGLGASGMTGPLIARARMLLSAYNDMEELIRIGAYKAGADPEIDEAIRLRPALEAFLSQGRNEHFSAGESFAALETALMS
mgnify:CR=1 FL=1